MVRRERSPSPTPLGFVSEPWMLVQFGSVLHHEVQDKSQVIPYSPLVSIHRSLSPRLPQGEVFLQVSYGLPGLRL